MLQFKIDVIFNSVCSKLPTSIECLVFDRTFQFSRNSAPQLGLIRKKCERRRSRRTKSPRMCQETHLRLCGIRCQGRRQHKRTRLVCRLGKNVCCPALPDRELIIRAAPRDTPMGETNLYYSAHHMRGANFYRTRFTVERLSGKVRLFLSAHRIPTIGETFNSRYIDRFAILILIYYRYPR